MAQVTVFRVADAHRAACWLGAIGAFGAAEGAESGAVLELESAAPLPPALYGAHLLGPLRASALGPLHWDAARGLLSVGALLLPVAEGDNNGC